jgi:hypothetical protein
MPDQSQYRPQVGQQTERSPQHADSPPAPAYTPPPADITKDPKKKSGFNFGKEERAAGKAGEHNLGIQFIEVWVGNARSARFTIQTSQGNALEAIVEQAAYNRTCSGTGAISTAVLPVAPIGTKGKVTARDTTTGEVLEKPWTWIDIGGAGASNLWATIKRLFWKG